MNFLIYEDFLHFIPTGKSWASGLFRNNQVVYNSGPRDGKLLEILEKVDTKIECVVFSDISLDKEYWIELDKIKQRFPDIKLIGMVCDYQTEYNLYQPYFNFVTSITFQHKSAEHIFKSSGYKYYNIPLATDDNIFKPLNTTQDNDISFVGQFGNTGHGYRRQDEYLFPLLDDKNLKAITGGFEYKNCANRYIQHESLNILFNDTKINLNFHYDHQKDFEDRIDLNGRTFEICAAGGFQLCDHPLAKQLIPSMIVEPDGKKWKDIVYYYLEHEDERKEIARKCREEVLSGHTWRLRMARLLHILENKD